MTLPAGVQEAIQKRMVFDGADQGFFGYKSWYPLQLTNKPAGEKYYGTDQRAAYYGEIRGYYPAGGGYFQPWNSTFHAASFQDPNEKTIRHRKHKGFDLYAHYLPWPLEIPVYALVNGELSQRSQHSNWNSLGNRVDLSFSVTVGGKAHAIVLSYGHLARFAPVPEGRKMREATIFEVKAGDLIGFIGKSGNADRDRESSKKELEFGVNAGHIHIGVRTGSTPHDPYPILNKRFGYHPDRDELFPDNPGDPKKSKGRQYSRSDFANMRLRPESDLPYIKDFSAGFDTGTRPGMRIAEQPKSEKKTPSRVPFPGVYRAIETNNTRHLSATQKAYELAKARLESDKTSDVEHVRYALFGPKTGEPPSEPWFKAYLENQDPAVWGDTLGDSLDRAKSHAARMAEVPSGSRAPYVAAMLLSLHEAIWILMFGPLVSGLCRQWAFAQDGAEPQTGIGIRGQVMATRYHETVGALHVASLKGTSVFSVTCGSGSLRHATFPAPSIFENKDGIDAKEYVFGVLKNVFWATRVLHAVIRLSADRLEPEKDNKLVAKVGARVTAIAVKAMALGDKAAGYLDDTKVEGFRDNLLKVLVSNNAILFAEATKLSSNEDTSAGLPHQPNLEWVGHIGEVAWSKETGGLRYE
jgi:murein DD-endopeptidase MepM/ murein hydrolase activator NlpD